MEKGGVGERKQGGGGGSRAPALEQLEGKRGEEERDNPKSLKEG